MSGHHDSVYDIDDKVESGKYDEHHDGVNWTPELNMDEVKDLDIGLASLKDGFVKKPADVAPEDFARYTFEAGLKDMKPASDFVSGDKGQSWATIAQDILAAKSSFEQRMATLEGEGGWKGDTHDAAVKNATASLAEPQAAAQGASTLSRLLEAFTTTIFQTKWYFGHNEASYDAALKRWPHHAQQVRDGYDTFARSVMTKVYAPSIAQIAADNPGFAPDTSAKDPNAGGPNPPAPPGGGDGDKPPAPPGSGDDPPPPPGSGDQPPAPPGSGDDPPAPPGSDDDPPAPPGSGDDPPAPPSVDDLAGQPPSLGGGEGGPSPADFPNLGALGGGGGGPSAADLPSFDAPTGNDEGAPGASDFPGLDSQNPLGGADGGGPGAGDLPQFDASQLPNSDLGGGPGPSDFPQLGDGGAGLGGPGAPGLGNAGLSGLPGGAGGALGGLGSQAAGGLSPVTDALKQALGQTGAGGSKAGSPAGSPFGGLPKGLPGASDLAREPGGAGSGGGGGGAGLGPRGGIDAARPPGTPIAAVSGRPGIPGLPTSIGAGGPAGSGAAGGGTGGGGTGGGGGQRGQGGKEHKSGKALRRRVNGELVMGEVDSVIPVIGGEDAKADDDAQRAPAPAQRAAAPRPATPWTRTEAPPRRLPVQPTTETQS